MTRSERGKHAPPPTRTAHTPTSRPQRALAVGRRQRLDAADGRERLGARALEENADAREAHGLLDVDWWGAAAAGRAAAAGGISVGVEDLGVLVLDMVRVVAHLALHLVRGRVAGAAVPRGLDPARGERQGSGAAQAPARHVCVCVCAR